MTKSQVCFGIMEGLADLYIGAFATVCTVKLTNRLQEEADLNAKYGLKCNSDWWAKYMIAGAGAIVSGYELGNGTIKIIGTIANAIKK